jgi:hypothetical protein
VIELQTDAVKALTAGVHEGVIKGSGRLIVGSVPAEVYCRIEEYARQGAGVPDVSKREAATATTTRAVPEQNTNTGSEGESSLEPARATLSCAGDR